LPALSWGGAAIEEDLCEVELQLLFMAKLEQASPANKCSSTAG